MCSRAMEPLLPRSKIAAALKEIFASSFSVLIGAADTGKTTPLKMLCELEDVAAGGILFLVPTGNARVQLETMTNRTGGFTIAQSLMHNGKRYNIKTSRYVMTANQDRCLNYRTVIVDECSMLTEVATSRIDRWAKRR